jgi:membrane fusion protein, multidrug efflux system
MKTRITLLLIFAVISLQFNACSNESQSKSPSDDETISSIPVEAGLVKRGDVSAHYHGTATLEARDEASVLAEVGGLIIEVLVEEGNKVANGQVLARLETEPFEIELARARASVNRLTNDYERNKTMYERNLVSAEVFENVKFELEVQKANLDLAQRNLEQTAIRAPISGVVATRHIKTGNRINPNQAAFDIIQMDPLLAIIHIPEHEMSKIQPGQAVNLGIDARPGTTFSGVVERISPVVDRSTGTARVTVMVNDRSGTLKPGMFARVSIVHSIHRNTLMIPRQAVISEDGRQSAYVIQDSIAVRKRFTTGYTNGQYIEVLEGLDEGEQVVTVGQASLRDSSRIQVIRLN